VWAAAGRAAPRRASENPLQNQPSRANRREANSPVGEADQVTVEGCAGRCSRVPSQHFMRLRNQVG